MTSTSPGPVDDQISTEAELDSALHDVLLEAHGNGVSIERTWTYRNGDSVPDWEVLVHELAKNR